MSESIEIVVKANGETTVEAKGVIGKGCQALTAAIESALGSRAADTLKPEFHKVPQVGLQAKAK